MQGCMPPAQTRSSLQNGESGEKDAHDDSIDDPVLSGDCARHVSYEPYLGGDRRYRILI
jgi:hypothetical protein